MLLGACRSRVPDVAAFSPVMAEDARIVSLLSEADALSDTDADGASHNLLDLVLPRARANADAATRILVQHPVAERLRREAVNLTSERASTIEDYGRALGARNTAAQIAVVHRQRLLENAMGHFEEELAAARTAPADHGCSVAPRTPAR